MIIDPVKMFAECLDGLYIDEDIVVVHTRLIPFKIKRENLEEICEILIDKIGKNKTIIMPSFTYSFSKKKIWSYHKSKSQAGMLTEYFREKIADERTIHPIHSVTILNNNYSISHNSQSSFGKGSAWEFICLNDVCNLSIGVGLNGGATICHYSEEFVQVNYRSYIKLEGEIFDKNNVKVDKTFTYYAREDGNNVTNNWGICEKDLIKNNIMKKRIFFKDIPVCYMNSKRATKFLIEKLSDDKKYLVEKE